MVENFVLSLKHCFSRLFSLVFLLLFVGHCIIAAPSFDPYAPQPTEENFDPAEADPRNNITCLGNNPDLQLPILNGFDPNQVTMQKLCAKPQYNGGPPGEHAGGYCIDPPYTYHIGEVAFDMSPAAQANDQLQNPRVLLACIYRCFCNYRLQDTSIQPKSNWPSFRTYLQQSRYSYELQLDINNDFSTPRAQKMGKRGQTSVIGAAVISFPELSLPQDLAQHGGEFLARLRRQHGGQHTHLSLDPGNEIECRGDLPTFILPTPYTAAVFISLQQMCATQPNGGKG